jgi:hypothetical protein
MSAKTVFTDIFALILGAEANLVPIVVKKPQSQAIAAVILTTEEEALQLLSGAGVAVPPATPAA